MIILDTNVLSELLRPVPNDSVVRWIDARESSLVFTTAITVQELCYGAELLHDTARGAALMASIETLLATTLADRVLPYDGFAARYSAAAIAARRRVGRPIHLADAQIAGIALSAGATLATRNLRDFTGTGVPLVDPWNPEGSSTVGG